MGNPALNKAKQAQKDEFYTRREDIERELTHYEARFREKTAYRNAGDARRFTNPDIPKRHAPFLTLFPRNPPFRVPFPRP